MLSISILKPGNAVLGIGEWRQEASVTQSVWYCPSVAARSHFIVNGLNLRTRPLSMDPQLSDGVKW